MVNLFVYHSGTDHSYAPRLMSYKDFIANSRPNTEFDIISAMVGFRPASIDHERLFSYGRISKNISWLA